MNRSCKKTSECDQSCYIRTFTLFKGTPSEMKYPCCLCPLNLMTQSTRQTKNKCPYDPNCSSMNACGAYLTDVVVNNQTVKCQKCKLCSKSKIHLEDESYIIF